MQSVISLLDQLDLFREYKGKLKETVGEDKAANIISKSVYIVCIGSDDIANTYFSTPLRKPHYDIPSYTDLMLNSATTFLQVHMHSPKIIKLVMIMKLRMALKLVATYIYIYIYTCRLRTGICVYQ